MVKTATVFIAMLSRPVERAICLLSRATCILSRLSLRAKALYTCSNLAQSFLKANNHKRNVTNIGQLNLTPFFQPLKVEDLLLHNAEENIKLAVDIITLWFGFGTKRRKTADTFPQAF